MGDEAVSTPADTDALISLSERERTIARPIVKEIQERLQFLVDVGLDYLSLDRAAATLSGGEAQRIRLATQIGSGLVGVLYVLDEPSIGLHQRDNEKLINTMLRLKKLGNTVIVVEHDEDTMRAADFIVDIGPAAGRTWRASHRAGHFGRYFEMQREHDGKISERQRSDSNARDASRSAGLHRN